MSGPPRRSIRRGAPRAGRLRSIARPQVVATASLAALVGGGGLGRIVNLGFGQQDYGQIIAGAVLYLRYRMLDRRLAPSRAFDIALWVAALLITAVALYAIPFWARNELWPTVKQWFTQT